MPNSPFFFVHEKKKNKEKNLTYVYVVLLEKGFCFNVLNDYACYTGYLRNNKSKNVNSKHKSSPESFCFISLKYQVWSRQILLQLLFDQWKWTTRIYEIALSWVCKS